MTPYIHMELKMKEILKSPFRDKNGKTIREKDICRSWHIDSSHPEGGYWILEIVKYENGVWLLYDKDLDYSLSSDKLHLLMEYFQDLEVVG